MLTTLQGVSDAVHVDFTVAQQVAAGLRDGEIVEVFAAGEVPAIRANVVALVARIDPTTRNAMVRARVDSTRSMLAPGASVRVRVPVGPLRKAVSIPVSALRKGPGGDQVFVIAPDQEQKTRAHVRSVESSAMVGDQVVIHAGLDAGETVAASGSFKLREGVLVAVAAELPQKEAHAQPVGQD